MQEFDISKIKMVDNNSKHPDIPIEKLLTGEYIQGLSENSGLMPTAELEGDEYLQFPDGTTQKVAGKSHEKGGADMAIPDGTKIISKTLKLKADQAKRLNRMFELDLSTKNSYAEAVDKYAAKIGLKKLNNEQEELISKLKTQLSKNMSESTLQVNKEYLSKKIFEIENKKKEKEALKREFFDRVFDMQESTKPKDDSNPNYRNGGWAIEGLKAIAQKYGVSEQKAMEMLNIDKLPRYQDGGRYNVTKKENVFADSELFRREQQSANEKNYGVDKSNEEIILNLYRNFPDIITSDDVFGTYVDVEALKTGEVKWKKQMPFNKRLQEVYNFQKRADIRMKATADDILKNPDKFSEDAINWAKQYKIKETFSGERGELGPNASMEDKVRAYDWKMGNFTSGRFAAGINTVTPDELKDLNKKGIFTLNQIDDETLKTLSPTTQARVEEIRSFKGKDSDYSLDVYSLPGAKSPEKKPEVKTPDQNFVDYAADYRARPQGSRFFYQPDQSGLAPSPLEAQLKVENRFGRIDPVKIGIDQNIQEIANSQKFVTRQLEGLPDAQRAAAVAGLLATSNDAINKAATQANVINAQNQSQAELFNIGQQDRENLAAGQNALNYEMRALRGRAMREEDLRNWFDRNKTVALNNFQNQRNLNLLDQMTPDFDLNFFGTGVEYNPSYDFQLTTPRGPEERLAYIDAIRALNTRP